MRTQAGVVVVQGRAVRANRVVISTHVEEHMRVIQWWLRANAHELFGANFDGFYTVAVVEVWYDFIGHLFAKLHGT